MVFVQNASVAIAEYELDPDDDCIKVSVKLKMGKKTQSSAAHHHSSV